MRFMFHLLGVAVEVVDVKIGYSPLVHTWENYDRLRAFVDVLLATNAVVDGFRVECVTHQFPPTRAIWIHHRKCGFLFREWLFAPHHRTLLATLKRKSCRFCAVGSNSIDHPCRLAYKHHVEWCPSLEDWASLQRNRESKMKAKEQQRLFLFQFSIREFKFRT